MRMMVTSKVPPPKVEDEHGLVRVEFVESVCQRGRGRLVNDLKER